MRIVGIVKDDYAYAAWNLFNALKSFGMDAHLINIGKRNPKIKANPHFYDVRLWIKEEKVFAKELLNTADVYHIFESGETLRYLKTLPTHLKKSTKRVVSLNSRKFYLANANKEIEKIKPHADILTALTLGILHKDVLLALQCVDESLYKVRESFTNVNQNSLIIGSAPGYTEAVKVKKIDVLKKHIAPINNVTFEILLNMKRAEVLKRMGTCYDAFTHGISFSGSYGYSMLEAAMQGTPCFTYINNTQRSLIEYEGECPILQLNPDCSNLLQVIDMLRDVEFRQICGNKTAAWARKFHSKKAVYERYSEIYKNLV